MPESQPTTTPSRLTDEELLEHAKPIGFAGKGFFVGVELSTIVELETRLYYLPPAGDPEREGAIEATRKLLVELKEKGLRLLKEHRANEGRTACKIEQPAHLPDGGSKS